MALGPRAAPVQARLQRAAPHGRAPIAASEVAGGMVARVAAADAEELLAALRGLLVDLPALLGDDPLARKW